MGTKWVFFLEVELTKLSSSSVNKQQIVASLRCAPLRGCSHAVSASYALKGVPKGRHIPRVVWRMTSKKH